MKYPRTCRNAKFAAKAIPEDKNAADSSKLCSAATATQAVRYANTADTVANTPCAQVERLLLVHGLFMVSLRRADDSPVSGGAPSSVCNCEKFLIPLRYLWKSYLAALRALPFFALRALSEQL